ncbi:MAG: tripartite tricarboxylate transporter substrate-binding protein [Burkholderiales bacterium]
MRRILSICFAAMAYAAAATAQTWPARPITLIVPFAPGGGIDASARIQAQALGQRLGQPLVVENIGAAAGTVGSARVAKAESDGYTLLIGNSGTHAYSQSVNRKPLYDSLADFTPVGLVSDSPRILVVRKDLPVANLREFVAYARTNQARMQFGSAGVGSGTHLPCVLLNRAIGVEVTHIPYRGAGPAMKDLVAGRIDYMCDTIQTGAMQAKGGNVKGIAVMAAKRVAIIPELATSGEQGLAGVEASVWNAFFLPKGAPRAIVDRLNGAMNDMLDDPLVRKRLEDLGLEIASPERRGPQYLARFMSEEIERWGKVVRAAGISVD